jgi:hypothetical protein
MLPFEPTCFVSEGISGTTHKAYTLYTLRPKNNRGFQEALSLNKYTKGITLNAAPSHSSTQTVS